MSFYYTYVLKSEIDNKLYIGYSEDLLNRVSEHNKKRGGRATKNRRPLTLIYYEACRNKKEAIEREKQLKTGFGRAFLKRRIASSFKD